MRILLIGHGKMGKEIERLALERGISVVAQVDSKSPSLGADLAQQADVAIHVAAPSAVLPHMQQWAAFGKNIVVGTTGWHKDIDAVQSIVSSKNIGMLYASNFSIGVNILFALVRQAGTLFNKFLEYDVFMNEIHHKDKADSPSGTALTLGKILLETVKRKKEILSAPPEGKIRPDQLHIASARAGAVVGTHRVTFDSIADSIELTHVAKNRTSFALGALLAAEWIRGKKGFFTMEDVVADLLKQP